jgi:hypothetical protein
LKNHYCLLPINVLSGYGAHGQLGYGSPDNTLPNGTAVDVGGPVSAYYAFDQSCAIVINGSGTCWGRFLHLILSVAFVSFSWILLLYRLALKAFSSRQSCCLSREQV